MFSTHKNYSDNYIYYRVQIKRKDSTKKCSLIKGHNFRTIKGIVAKFKIDMCVVVK